MRANDLPSKRYTNKGKPYILCMKRTPPHGTYYGRSHFTLDPLPAAKRNLFVYWNKQLPQLLNTFILLTNWLIRTPTHPVCPWTPGWTINGRSDEPRVGVVWEGEDRWQFQSPAQKPSQNNTYALYIEAEYILYIYIRRLAKKYIRYIRSQNNVHEPKLISVFSHIIYFIYRGVDTFSMRVSFVITH